MAIPPSPAPARTAGQPSTPITRPGAMLAATRARRGGTAAATDIKLVVETEHVVEAQRLPIDCCCCCCLLGAHGAWRHCLVSGLYRSVPGCSSHRSQVKVPLTWQRSLSSLELMRKSPAQIRTGSAGPVSIRQLFCVVAPCPHTPKGPSFCWVTARALAPDGSLARIEGSTKRREPHAVSFQESTVAPQARFGWKLERRQS